MDVRDGGPYVLSQFIGGMAAPLFLFMAGMTLAFQMESLERRESDPWRRWMTALRRGAYILAIAYLFRITNWLAGMPRSDWHEITKVDILNCMGLAMIAMAAAAIFSGNNRARFAAAAGLAIAAAAPLIANLEWGATPQLIHEYLAPGQGRGRFPFFPAASYLAFGLAAGTIVKRTVGDRFERLMQWTVVIGIAAIFTAQYFSNTPYSVYPKSNFWTDSPALIIIRVGVILLAAAGAYLWTEYVAAARWSWMQCLGKNSLMVYWVHVMLVYGDIAKRFKRALSVPATAAATAMVTLMMVALSAAWLWWKERRAEKRKVPRPVEEQPRQPIAAS
jgi:uncharacterized membrane protein